MSHAKRVDRGGKHASKSSNRKAGVTLIEMLVSVAILLILMVIIFQIIQLVSKAWKTSSQSTNAMQQARVAFERMTRNLSQATLNTYYSYYYASGATTPSYYMRQSELQFISGIGPVAGGGISFISPGATTGNAKQITHAVFFQAPLGVVSSGNASNYGNLTNLLNACGYFVIYDKDTLTPSLFTSPPTGLTVPQNPYRFRLMEYLQPSENLGIYSSGAVSASGTTVPPWISIGIPDLTQPQTAPVTVRTLANNIVALIVMPEQFSQGTSLGAEQNTTFVYTPTSGSPSTTAGTYNYDSAYQASTLTSGAQAQTANQLPPLVKVIMVAIDEPSAIKLAAAYPAASASVPPPLVQTGMFTNPANLFTTGGVEGDLDLLQDILNALPGNLANNSIKLNYYVFQTDVIIRGSKWTSQ